MNDITQPKPRGRPRAPSPAGLTPFERTREGLDMTDGRDPNDQVKAERVRVPLGSGQATWFMNYPFEWDKYHYYTFHEDGTRGGRVNEALNAWYEHCTIGGENVKRPSGSGWDYLMRLPADLYAQDVARAREQRQAIERAQNTLKGDGKLQEYGIDPRTGKAFTDGEAIAKQSVSSEMENPYA